MPPDVFRRLREAQLIARCGSKWQALLRYSSLGNALYAHGAYPTTERDAVFFGPDSHRFSAALHRHVPECEVLVDIGCGSGVGGLQIRHRARHVMLADINDRALLFAAANARMAGATNVVVRRSDLLSQISEVPDVIVSNPPYLVDEARRTYRDGGGSRGISLAHAIVEESLKRLRPGGRLVLYTGTPVVRGSDLFMERIGPLLNEFARDVVYEELDPDVFGEELDRAPYSDVDRIAVVLLCLARKGPGSSPRANRDLVRHTPVTARSVAPEAGDGVELHALHSRLSEHVRHRLTPAAPGPSGRIEAGEAHDEEAASAEMASFLDGECEAVATHALPASTDADAFLVWFSALEYTGPGQHDPLFDWLANEADLDQFRWFLSQEQAGEAGFDDLVALTQVKMPPRPKMEMARNFWDEFGRGKPRGVHGMLLNRVEHDLELSVHPASVRWEPLALANLMAGMALDRHYAYHSVGALGAIEMTAPGRVSKLDEGLRRLGVSSATRCYFRLHATLDVEHSLAWNREVIHPLVEADPQLARPIAEGALMRLEAGRRCFAAYNRYFDRPEREPPVHASEVNSSRWPCSGEM